ncbi:acetylcholinesterase [Rhipicephalus microplus]|uniref:acetylcholinesterase n=1 Tax=Rhipicephalus microplus TaxID=6941 RepID=UPI003F6D3B09
MRLLLLLLLLLKVAHTAERRTSLGIVRGKKLRVLHTVVEEYRGIPYARPPIGGRRFRPPEPALPWEATLDATDGRTACPQVLRPWSNGVLRVSEDCLYLNVWTTVARWEHEMAPVLVWIHGGGFTSGSASYDNYSAAVLAAKTGCVVASINYRLGILGFLNADTPDAPGNVGLMDQRVALLWLRQNARVFGGDPAAITVFGHSAGGMSIHSHMLSPFGGNLFHRAVMMSGNMAARDFFESVEESAAKADAVAALVGCAQATLSRGPREVLACLRTKPSGDLVRAAARAVAPKVFPFLPTYHTDYLPRVPVAATAKGFVANVDLLLGVTENEGSTPFVLRMKAHMQSERLTDVAESALRASLHDVVRAWTKGEQLEMLDLYVRQAKDKESLRKQYVAYVSDRLFVCPAHFLGEHHSASNGTVYFYVFAYPPPKGTPSWIGVGHSMELPYFFGHPVINRVGFSQQDEQYSEEVMKMLSTFAHTGVPKSGSPWPRYNRASPTTVQLDGSWAVGSFRHLECAPWLETK